MGTRPEAIKMLPVVQALRASELLCPFVVNTGQHADLVLPILRAAGIEPDVDLQIGREKNTINGLVRDCVGAFDELLTELRGGPERRNRPRLFGAAEHPGSAYPALTLVHGDTTSAMAAAMASIGCKLPVVHVEAGLRTRDILSPFPEELNRQLISRMAAFHLAPTPANQANLIREGVDAQRVFVTGNTGIDALHWAAGLHAAWPDDRLRVLDDPDVPVVVVTAHRRENLGQPIRRIATAVQQIAQERPDVVIVWPVHPNPQVRKDVFAVLGMTPNVILTQPIDYIPFARLLQRATLAISDSGGVQEEAPSVGTPVLVAREESERPEGVEAGSLILVGSDVDRIRNIALTLLDDPAARQAMTAVVNPFGDGHAADRVRAALEHLVFDTAAPERFGAAFSRARVLEASGYDPREIAITSERIAQAHPEIPQGSGATRKLAALRR
ncbi:MAG TPA: UDP-N-acetylglucosamine 2-epimerase (non-hydrolyzing) [Actinomycetota bacterium]|jgi:UDP-N-acetylglucosamine 2-epimerase (non-hydrolysing)|nr:UDP-N-acetylglucosamine 2-epimerase (non-hydrolyzing) [Actinomycetota bacterium]